MTPHQIIANLADILETLDAVRTEAPQIIRGGFARQLGNAAFEIKRVRDYLEIAHPGHAAEEPKAPEMLSREFTNAQDALRFAESNRPVVIRLDGKVLVIRKEDANRLDATGAMFAFVHEIDGRIVTVPVNS